MKDTELRKGNYVGFGVLHTGLGQEKDFAHYTVDQLREASVFFVESNVGEYYKDVQPLPLTEEWLLKFGFNTHAGTNGTYYSKHWGKNGLEIITKDYHYKGFEMELGKARFKSVESVHQLQNIFYVLTGEELKLKQQLIKKISKKLNNGKI